MKISTSTCLLVLNIFLFSCTGKTRAYKDPVYNEGVNQQFWTADWSPDDRWIAVAGVDSTLRILHAQSLKIYKTYPTDNWVHVVKWHPEGKILAVATLHNYVYLFNPETGITKTLNSTGGSRAMDWNADGSLLAVGDLDGGIKIWDKNGNQVKAIKKGYGPETVGTAFISLDWHPEKDIFVATNFEINVYDAAGQELRTMQHANPAALMLCVNWNPSGTFFTLGDYGHNWEGENVPSLLHFWSENGTLIKSIPGSKGEYRNIAWNKEGTMLATASDVLRLWSKDGTLLHESKPDSSNYLWGIDWNTAGDKIVTASKHKSIALWNAKAKLLKRIDVDN